MTVTALRQRAYQPPSSIGIDWSNRITQGLVAAFIPSSKWLVDLISDNHAVPNASVSASASRYGRAVEHGGDGTTPTNKLVSPFRLTPGSEFSVMWIGRILELSGSVRFALSGQGEEQGTSDYDWLFPYFASDGAMTFFPINGSSTGNSTRTFSNGENAVCLGTYQSGVTNGAKLYIDGIEEAAATVNGTTTADWDLGFGFDFGGGASDIPVHAATSLYVVFDRALSPFEVASLSRRPWQIFRPELLQFPVAAGGTTVELAGTMSSESDADASPALAMGLSADMGSESEASAGMDAQPGLSGAASSESALDAGLGLLVGLAGQMSSESDADSSLGLDIGLSGDVVSASQLDGVLSLAAELLLSGTASSVSELSASLGRQMGLAGTVTSETNTEALIGLLQALRGRAESVSAAVGALALEMALRGDLESVSTLSGALSEAVEPGALVIDRVRLVAALEGSPKLQAALEGLPKIEPT